MMERSSLLSRTTALVVLAAALFLFTGCGGGGSSSSPLNPVSPGNPTTPGTTGSVSGYVSQSKVSGSLRTNVGASLANPMTGAACQLIAIAQGGAETVLGTTQTDANGYYLFNSVQNPTSAKNLIVRASSGATVHECVLPQMKAGLTVQAPTIDPQTSVQAKVVKQAALSGDPGQLNLAELLAVLPPDLLEVLETKIQEVVENFLARENARRQKLGANANTLLSYSFEIQQEINEMIERGELSASEAWKKYALLMEAKAKSLGISAENLKSISDLDQIFLLEPFSDDFSDPDSWEEYEKIKREQLRERKLKALDLLVTSFNVLAPDFVEFAELAETFRSLIQKAQTVDDLHMIFMVSSTNQRKFLEYLNHALARVNFPLAYIGDVFAIQPPTYGYNSTPKTIATAGSSSQVTVGAAGTPTSRADSFIAAEEANLQYIMDQVRAIAIKSQITPALTDEQIKAVAYILWAGSSENLYFPPPPPPVDEPPFSDFSMSGTVMSLAAKGISPPQVAEITFTHGLTYGDLYYMGETGATDGSTLPGAEYQAYLAATQPFEIVSMKDASVAGTTTTGTLDDLTAHELVELECLLIKAPPIMDYPTPIGPPGSPDNPIPLSIKARKFRQTTVTGTSTTTSSSGSGSAPGSSGSTYPGTPNGVDIYNPEPYYLVVRKAFIMPPPPPPPVELSEELGRIVPVKTSSGVVIPGYYAFESPNDLYNGAILEPDYPVSIYSGVESLRQINLAIWADQMVRISGTYFSDPATAKKTILVRDIQAAQ
jgi:hypothetical protein